METNNYKVLLNPDLQFHINDPQAEFEGAKMSAKVRNPKRHKMLQRNGNVVKLLDFSLTRDCEICCLQRPPAVIYILPPPTSSKIICNGLACSPVL